MCVCALCVCVCVVCMCMRIQTYICIYILNPFSHPAQWSLPIILGVCYFIRLPSSIPQDLDSPSKVSSPLKFLLFIAGKKKMSFFFFFFVSRR